VSEEYVRLAAASLVFCLCALAADPALTIYNQNFAVVRDTVALELKQGANKVQYTGVTAYLEPNSVSLRDPSGKLAISVLEQSYRGEPVSATALLAEYEGKTIDFLVRSGDRTEIVQGKILRAGQISPTWSQPTPYYYGRPPVPDQPLVEVGGKLRFELPGTPLFPTLSGDSVLKPVLDWTVHSPAAAKLDAELAYVTAGMNWEATYNIVQSTSDRLEVIGWVSMDNRSGRTFSNARIKLMAGDVNKVVRPELLRAGMGGGVIGGVIGGMPGAGLPGVAEKTFDEYHLYTLPNTVTLFDKQSKQVEFLRAQNVKADVIYVYDGMKLDTERLRQMPPDAIRMDPSFGTQSTEKVWVMREFENSKANGLGMPLPKGKVRFYRRDTDAQMEFTGEDTINHKPAGERVRVFTGAAFDLVGEHKRTTHRIDHQRSTIDESFEIKVRNRKKDPVEVRIVEHLHRVNTWEIPVTSVPFTKRDSSTIEFQVSLQPGEEKTVTYAVRYTW
jgi:hypothetical protein